MATPTTHAAVSLQDTRGFRLWFFVALLLVAGLGPVLNSENWDSWNSERRLLKIANWTVTAAASVACLWCLRVPGIRGVLNKLRLLPWLLAFTSLFMLYVFSRGSEPIGTLFRAGYTGTSAFVWFSFFKRYSFVLRSDTFTDAEWQKLVGSPKPRFRG